MELTIGSIVSDVAQGFGSAVVQVLLLFLIVLTLGYVRRHRGRRAEKWLRSQMPEVSARHGEDQTLADPIRFPLVAIAQSRPNSTDPAEWGQFLGSWVWQFADPEARLQAGALIIVQGPRRAAAAPLVVLC